MIPLVDLKRQYKTIQKSINQSIKKVLDNSDFILGADVAEFEKEFAAFAEVPYAVGADSGTGALELALNALGIGSGDEVIVPVFTFYATASSVAAVGAKPVFVDVIDDTGNMDPSKIEAAITSKTKAIMPVHLFGQPANMAKILAISKAHSLPIIEDTAQAHGAKVQLDGRWKVVGGLGEMGCFSFYPGKNLGAYGDGGMVITRSQALSTRLKLLRDYGRTGKYEHSILGYNRRLDSIQAAILRVKLKSLDRWNQRRRELGEFYDAEFAKVGIRTFKIEPFAVAVRHVYAIRAANRDALAAHLAENGVATGVHYPVPLHLQKAFEFLGYKEGDFPVAEAIAKEILSLPIFPELKDAEARTIVRLVKKFSKTKK